MVLEQLPTKNWSANECLMHSWAVFLGRLLLLIYIVIDVGSIEVYLNLMLRVYESMLESHHL